MSSLSRPGCCPLHGTLSICMDQLEGIAVQGQHVLYVDPILPVTVPRTVVFGFQRQGWIVGCALALSESILLFVEEPIGWILFDKF